MGWGDCGNDSKGRPIGYAFEATCDHPECDNLINRGLSHACGGMHGDCAGKACEGYFCDDHLNVVDKEAMLYDELYAGVLCDDCKERAIRYIGETVVSGDMQLGDPYDD